MIFIVIRNAISIAFSILNLLLLIRVILSFLPGLRNGFTELIYRLTEPVLTPIRGLLFKYSGNMMFDFSPILAFLLLGVAQWVLDIVFGILVRMTTLW